MVRSQTGKLPLLSGLFGTALLLLTMSSAHARNLRFLDTLDETSHINYNYFSPNNWYILDENGNHVHVFDVPNPQDNVVIEANQTANVAGSTQVTEMDVYGGATVNNGTITMDTLRLFGGLPTGATLGPTTINVRAQMVVTSVQNTLLGSTINIQRGAVALMDTSGGRAQLQLESGAIIDNLGSFVMHDNAVLGASSGGGTFRNLAGADLSSGPTGTAIITSNPPLNFDNSGLVAANGGTLRFTGYTTWSSSSGSGAFRAAVNATLDLAQTNAFAVPAGATFTFKGPGTMQLNNGQAGLNVQGQLNIGAVNTVGQQYEPATLTLLGSEVAGAGIIRVVGSPKPLPVGQPASVLNLVGGVTFYTNSDVFRGAVDIDSGATLNINFVSTGFTGFGSTLLGTFNNQGTTTLTGNGDLAMGNSQLSPPMAATFNNLASGVFDVQADSNIGFNGGTPVSTFNNSGLFRKSAGPGNTRFLGNFNNTGTVDLKSGTIRFDNFHQTAGVINLDGGNLLSPFNNVPFTLNGGLLTGTGTITGNVSSGGIISPGHSPGALTITGDYTQTVGGVLNLELAGHTPGTQYDQLNITGAATLAGTLNAQLLSGFHPLASDRFAVLNAATVTGTFGTVSGPMNATYSGTAVTLAFNPKAPIISSFTPASGLPGATVTITGVNLGAASVLFNGVHAVVNTSLSTATRLVVTVPPGAQTGALRVTTSNGSAISATPFTVLALVRSVISGTVTRPATPTAPAAPLANVPVLLATSTNLTALAIAAANPVLLTANAALVSRTVTNAAGQYSFSALPGAYVVVAVAPGISFNPLLHTVSVANSAVPNQNFVQAGLDGVAPVATISTATPASVTGTATDSGATASGVFTVLVTLQNSHGQFLNWTAATPVFTAAPVVGSFKLANAPGGSAPITNVAKVTTQNWAVLVPAVLPAGSYTVTVRAIDRAFKVSAPVSRVIVKPAAAHSMAVLSAASASAANSCVTLKFADALDPESAADPSRYTVSINGQRVAVGSAGYNASARSVSLALAADTLRAGDRVNVTWDGSGQAGPGQGQLVCGTWDGSGQAGPGQGQLVCGR